MRLLFVCLGNICRSPTAEGVMRSLLAGNGYDGEIVVDSAGIGDWHVGSPPDERAVAAAAARGFELGGTARQVRPSDFEEFDLLVAMDSSNRDALLRMAPHPEAEAKVRMLREFGDGVDADVPDPYYGGADGFAEVLEIIERNCAALLEHVVNGRE
jgi:protein-tyrosine phosphatase